MLYAEAAYFDGAHVQHIADWQEHHRLLRLHREARARIERQPRSHRLFNQRPILRLAHSKD